MNGNDSDVELFALSQGKRRGIFRCNACQETNTLLTGTLRNYVSDTTESFKPLKLDTNT